MSEIFKIVGIGLVTTVLAIMVKQQKPELAIGISIAGSIVIFFMIISPLQVAMEAFQELSSKTGIDTAYIQLILKVIGIAYLVQFAAEAAKDAGETAVASKLELAGKVCIFALAAPVVLSFMDTIINLIP